MLSPLPSASVLGAGRQRKCESCKSPKASAVSSVPPPPPLLLPSCASGCRGVRRAASTRHISDDVSDKPSLGVSGPLLTSTDSRISGVAGALKSCSPPPPMLLLPPGRRSLPLSPSPLLPPPPPAATATPPPPCSDTPASPGAAGVARVTRCAPARCSLCAPTAPLPRPVRPTSPPPHNRSYDAIPSAPSVRRAMHRLYSSPDMLSTTDPTSS
mmetsp:Transcript_14863/g.36468  ORF Transcript_14863/g.36468 Transcript_14863/m.36468 type:complete len:213 (+) Transcript_14863:1938-2576(+)